MTSIERSLAGSVDSDPARIGAYGIQARLSAGDSGPVYLARSEDGTRVVVKVVAPALARERGFLDRLEAELAVVRRAAPFGVAEVVEIATRSTPPHVVVEYVDGPTLDVTVATSGPLPAGDTYRLAVSLATALAGLHSVPVVFGGLKPSNVVMSERGLRLLNFGTTQAAYVASPDRRRATGGVLGTPAFIAPELALGRPAGSAADIFAWGACVLFAATGRLPFGDGPTKLAVQRAVYTEPDLRGLERPLRTLVRVAMRKDPAARLTAAELVLALVGLVGQAEGRGHISPVRSIPRQANPTDGAAAATLVRFPTALEQVEPAEAELAPEGDLTLEQPERAGAAGVESAPEPAPEPGSESAPEPGSESALESESPPEPEPEPEPQPQPVPKPEAEAAPGPAASLETAPEPEPEATPRSLPLPVHQTQEQPARSPDKVFVRALLAVVAAVAVATPVVAGLGKQSRAEAAEDSRRLASDALALVDRAPDLAGQLAVTAQRIAPSTEAAEALIASTVRQTGDHAGPVHGVAVSSDGTLLVTIGDDGASVWDASDPRQVSLVARFAPDEAVLTSVALSPVASADGWLVATAGPGESVQLWRVALGRPAAEVATLAGHDGQVGDLVFSPDGAMLASSDAAGTVRLWDVSDDSRPMARSELRHEGAALSAAFAPGRDLLVVGSADRVSTWDVSDLDQPVRRDDVRRTGAVGQVVFGPDGRTLIAVVSGGGADGADGADASVQLFRVDESGRTNHVGDFGDASRGAVAAGYADDAQTAVTVRADGTIALWSLEDPADPVRREVLTAEPDATGVVVVAAGDSRMLAVSSGSTVRLWQLDAAAAAKAVCTRVSEPVTEQQWRYYLPDRDFEPPCG